MACLFGHKWNGCKCERCGITRDEQHDWDLCRGVCKRCGKTQEAQHDWHGCYCNRCHRSRHELDEHCKCRLCGCEFDTPDNNCACTRCGKELHKWIPLPSKCLCRECRKQIEHTFDDHCKCIRCGGIDHDYDGCVCRKCGAINNSNNGKHDMEGCRCKRCGQIFHQGLRQVNMEWTGSFAQDDSRIYRREYVCDICGEYFFETDSDYGV